MKKEVIKIETFSAKESADLVKRRPGFLAMVVGQYLLSFFGPERSRILRASYLPIRKVDDALDGDAPKILNPLLYVTELRENITRNQLNKSSEERLLQYALDSLESKAKPNDNPREDFISAIDAIIFDYDRSSKRKVLSTYEIEQYYRNAFDPVMNITLMAIDSSLRSRDIPVLSYGQGRVYSARDFRKDWIRGIINIPGEIISSSGLTSLSPVEEAIINPTIIDWFHQSLVQTKPDLITTQSLLAHHGERQTQAVCNSLILPMLKFIDTH